MSKYASLSDFANNMFHCSLHFPQKNLGGQHHHFAAFAIVNLEVLFEGLWYILTEGMNSLLNAEYLKNFRMKFALYKSRDVNSGQSTSFREFFSLHSVNFETFFSSQDTLILDIQRLSFPLEHPTLILPYLPLRQQLLLLVKK